MTRKFSEFGHKDFLVHDLLRTLTDEHSDSISYRTAMKLLGNGLGKILVEQISGTKNGVYLACTVEDADFFGKGILDILEKQQVDLSFACFWNEHYKPFGINDLTVAPIVRKYQEPPNRKVKYLIVVKSIISGACVVKTNLTALIEKIAPEHIFIVAPVMHERAEERLRNEFDEKTSSLFRFFYYAKDSERTEDGTVVPGVGGSVYERLGLGDSHEKNTYIPEIVKERRKRFATSRS
ncbi:MAG: hypothetical protein H7Y37_11865 [Anaerolineae bacterium]|nr:hypothetical protein [Gloeobacterales cyanobacterium ES-bin-313]